MSQPRSVYTNEILAFINNGQQKVLLLHGKWGTGKTYFWKEFAQRNRDAIRESFYSYVSLFGASSISSVKNLLIFGGQALRSASGLDDTMERVKTWVARKGKYFRALKIPYLADVGALLPTFEELLIKDYLVCFDDLERRNKALDLEQFFGLVSVLKEQNDCRIVIICNETELSVRDLKTLNKYREKIVDRQLTYEPLFDENFRIIFPEANASIREVFEAVGLNNIRVFQQAKWCVDYFEPHLKGCHAGFAEKFNQQCTRFACVHFALSKEITLEQLTSTSWLAVAIFDRNGLRDAAKEIVRNLQFLPTKADEFIVDYLRNGYCDTSELQATIEKLNQEYRRGEADQVLTEIYAKVWHSYQSNSEEIARAAEDYVTKYRDSIPFKYASDLLDFVKKIHPSFNAEGKKESVAKAIIQTADAGTLRLIQTACDSSDIREQAKAKQQQLVSRKSIEQLVLALGESNGWNPSDFAELNEYSEDELFEWLKTAHQPYLVATIAEVIARGQLESADNRGGREIGIKFRKVFDRLAEQSSLDKERTAHAFALVRRQLKQYGRETPPDICPPESGDQNPV
jgi:hypothetical protein